MRMCTSLLFFFRIFVKPRIVLPINIMNVRHQGGQHKYWGEKAKHFLRQSHCGKMICLTLFRLEL